MLIDKRDGGGFKHWNDYKARNGYSNDADDMYENVAEYNPNKECKRLIVFIDR